MAYKRVARRRRFFGVLRWFSVALIVALQFAFLPMPAGSEAAQQGGEAVVTVSPTEPEGTKPAEDMAGIVHLVHINAAKPETEPDIEEPVVGTLPKGTEPLPEVTEPVTEETEPIPEETDPVPEETEPVTEATEPYYEPLYTEADAIALTKMAWGEARGCSDMEIAATMWCVLNRFGCGDPYYQNCKTIESIVKQGGAFAGYSESNPVDEHLLWIAYDVLDRWNAEQYGETDVGRVLPPEYLFFHGDGTHNHFRVGYKHNGQYYDWSLESPYES